MEILFYPFLHPFSILTFRVLGLALYFFHGALRSKKKFSTHNLGENIVHTVHTGYETYRNILQKIERRI